MQLEASVDTEDSTISLKDLCIRENIASTLSQLQAIAEFCLFGLGVGAVRHEEVVRLTVRSVQWHNSYLYFWTESLKQGSMRGDKKPRLIEHRLSLTLSRIFLLIRCSFVSGACIMSDELIPQLQGASMLSLVRDIFDFDSIPMMLNVRHFFTSIGNILLPENNIDGHDGALVSSTSLTEKSGHTQGTGRRAYGTYLENSEELMYDMYHKSLGEILVDPPALVFTPYSDAVLHAALKALLGVNADFRSRQQKMMVDIAANSIVRHSYVGIPCGHGKSLSWLVPTMASYLAGRHIGLRIVILPYKFLLGHMVHQAKSMFGLLNERLRVDFVDSSDMEEQTLLPILQGDTIPSILFINLDGASTLMRLHMTRLQKLAKSNILKRIYVDEFQQLIAEFGFRSAYQHLRDLGRIGIPVMRLSGSLPISIATSLMSYCRLSVGSHLDAFQTVPGNDPIGSGFFFDMKIVENLAQSIVESVLSCKASACHVICDTKVLVEKVTCLLANHRSLLTVTGDTPSHEQMRCAKDWATGAHDVLVSTIVALVGNENKQCRKIIVGGFLYNVSSLVQAMGRLRPEQRGPGSIVEVIRLPLQQTDTKVARETETNSFQELVSASCLNVNCKEDYSNNFSPVGLQKIQTMKQGCYLKTLSLFYGYARPPCLNCRLCYHGLDSQDDVASKSSGVPSPTHNKRTGTFHSSASPQNKHVRGVQECAVESRHELNKRTGSFHLGFSPQNKLFRGSIESDVKSAQEYAVEASHEERRIRRLADNVFRELLYRCIICGSAACIGECGRWCYRCGDPLHDTNSCSFTIKKLSLILANKGVCFGCFDTRQRGIDYHTMKDCPLRRRLRRLLFADRARRKIQFEPYLRLIYTDEMTFLNIVSTFSDGANLGR